jgi:hypothetical protein
MDTSALSRVEPSLGLDQAFWASAAAGNSRGFASPSAPSPPSLAAMRLLMLLNNAYLLFSTTFNTLCVGAALVWSDSSCPLNPPSSSLLFLSAFPSLPFVSLTAFAPRPTHRHLLRP